MRITSNPSCVLIAMAASLLLLLVLPVHSLIISSDQSNVNINVTTDNSKSPTTITAPPVITMETKNVTLNETQSNSTRVGRVFVGEWDPRGLAPQFTGSPVFSGGFMPIQPPPQQPTLQQSPPQVAPTLQSPSQQTPTQQPTPPQSVSQQPLPQQPPPYQFAPQQPITESPTSTNSAPVLPYYIYSDTGDSDTRFFFPSEESTNPIPIPLNPPPTNDTAFPTEATIQDRILTGAYHHQMLAAASNNMANNGKDSIRKGPDMDFSKLFLGTLGSVFTTAAPSADNNNKSPAMISVDPAHFAAAQAAYQAATAQKVVPLSQPPSQAPVQVLFQGGQDPLLSLGTAPPNNHPFPMLSLPSSIKDHFHKPSEIDNKRYGGKYDPYDYYHHITQSHHPPHYPPPPPVHHHHPYPHAQHHGGGDSLLGGLGGAGFVDAIHKLKKNMAGSAHQLGKKIAHIATPQNLAVIVPAATTLLVGGLALRLLSQQNNTQFPLFPLTLGKRSPDGEVQIVKNFTLPPLSKPMQGSRRVSKMEEFPVDNNDPTNETHVHRRSITEENQTLAQERSAFDGTFTEDELNALVSRLDPVQKQFLQKLQHYGFDRWKEMPCAKYILCTVMVHSDLQHIYDMQRRIGIFLSLMDDESARKVEIMVKDLILSIEARDCSQFYCDASPYPPLPPPHPLHFRPPPPPPLPIHPHYMDVYKPFHYRHPYSFPRGHSIDKIKK